MCLFGDFCLPGFGRLKEVEGAAEIVKAITNRQRQVDWHLTGYNAERLNSSISVDLFNNSAEIALDEGFQDCPHFLDVAFGPGHL